MFVPSALVIAEGTDAVVTVTDAEVVDGSTGGSGGGGGSAGGSGGADGGAGGSDDSLGASGASPYGALSLGLLSLALGTARVAFVRRRRI